MICRYNIEISIFKGYDDEEVLENLGKYFDTFSNLIIVVLVIVAIVRINKLKFIINTVINYNETIFEECYFIFITSEKILKKNLNFVIIGF